MMEKLFSDTHYEKTVLNMLMILTDNGRLSLTSKVIDTFEKIMEAHNKISLIKVTSATVRLIF
jgi:F0F1-type ATP synthase delta subunit